MSRSDTAMDVTLANMKKITHRLDGRVEWVCNHGVGHPWAVWQGKWETWMSVHGCDGCCPHWHEEDLI